MVAAKMSQACGTCRPYAGAVPELLHFTLTTNLRVNSSYCTHLTDEEIKVQRSTYSRSNRWKWQRRIQTQVSDFRAQTLDEFQRKTEPSQAQTLSTVCKTPNSLVKAQRGFLFFERKERKLLPKLSWILGKQPSIMISVDSSHFFMIFSGLSDHVSPTLGLPHPPPLTPNICP